MVEEHECDFSDTCLVCQGPKKEESTEFKWRTMTVARFDGHCRKCNLPIMVGQTIVNDDDESWKHRDC